MSHVPTDKPEVTLAELVILILPVTVAKVDTEPLIDEYNNEKLPVGPAAGITEITVILFELVELVRVHNADIPPLKVIPKCSAPPALIELVVDALV
jgi:hypothetical protein